MKLLLERKWRKQDYTIGRLYVDGAYFCNTLEDYDRLYFGGIKVNGRTAIPVGTYKITLSVKSPKYASKAYWKSFNGGYMPRLLSVPQFSGILIHTGNTASDTDGCILVGKNTKVGQLTESLTTFKKLYKLMKAEKGEITITIK